MNTPIRFSKQFPLPTFRGGRYHHHVLVILSSPETQVYCVYRVQLLRITDTRVANWLFTRYNMCNTYYPVCTRDSRALAPLRMIDIRVHNTNNNNTNTYIRCLVSMYVVRKCKNRRIRNMSIGLKQSFSKWAI